MDVPSELESMLEGSLGRTKQKAARLVVDLASTAGVDDFIEVDNAHVSGVSVITGGHGLRRFLSDLSGDPLGKVSIPTTLNSAGCDHEKIEEMGIDYPNFLEQQFEIVRSYLDYPGGIGFLGRQYVFKFGNRESDSLCCHCPYGWAPNGITLNQTESPIFWSK